MTTDRPAFTAPGTPGSGPKTGTGFDGASWDPDEDRIISPEELKYYIDHMEELPVEAPKPQPQPTTQRFVVTIDVTTPGHPRAALESSLRQLPRKVYEVVSVDGV